MEFSPDSDALDASTLASTMLAEEERRHEEARQMDETPELASDELFGVGGQAMSLRQVLKVGGIATLGVLLALNLINEVDGLTLSVLSPEIQRSFHLSYAGLTFVSSIGAVAVFAGMVPLGLMADRRLRPVLVGVTSIIWGAFSLVTGFVTSAWQFAVVRTGNGVGKGNIPVVQSLLSDQYPIEGRNRVFAVYNVASFAGPAFGPIFAAVIATIAGGTNGWRWAFVILGLPAMGFGVMAFFLRDPGRGKNELTEITAEMVEKAEAVTTGEAGLFGATNDVGSSPFPVSSTAISMSAAFDRLKKVKTFTAIMSAVAALGLMLSGGPIIFNIYLRDHYHLDAISRGTVASLASLGGLVGMAVGAPFADRLFRKDPSKVLKLVAALLAFFPFMYVTSLYMPKTWELVLWQIPAGVCLFSPAICGAMVASIVPYRMRGFSFAMVGLYTVVVGGLIGGVMTGILADSVGPRTALSIMIPLGCFIAAIFLVRASGNVHHDMALVVEEMREELEEAERLRHGNADDHFVQVRNLDFSYGPVQVLFDINLEVARGETLALLGTNGAGKSTLLRAISGLALPDRGVIRLNGTSITYQSPSDRVRGGIVQVAGGRAVFPSMSVEENLLVGASTFIWDQARIERKTEEVLDLFPGLRPLLQQPAGTLSGGEQQMLALAKALLLDPELLLIDELSLGLAPIVVQEDHQGDRAPEGGRYHHDHCGAVNQRGPHRGRSRRLHGEGQDQVRRSDPGVGPKRRLGPCRVSWRGLRIVLAITYPPAIFLIGVCSGLVYALVAAGLVLIYRCTGVVNFAYGALGSLCAGVLAKLVLTFHINYLLCFLMVTLMGAVLGALMEFTVIRRLFHAPRIVVLIATIGLAQLFYLVELLLPLGTSTFRYPVPFNRQVSIGHVVFNGGDFLALALVPTIVIVLGIFLTRTPMGMSMRASAENPDAAELAGVSVKRISTYVWSLGGALAAITVVLYNPIQGVLVGVPQDPFGPGILLPSLAAALVGRMTSLPWALAGGIGMGVIESFINVNTTNGGTADAIFFVIILVLLLVRKADVGGAQSEALVAIPRPKAVPAVLLQRRLFRQLPRLSAGTAIVLAMALPLVITGSSDLFSVSRVLLYAVAAISTTVLVGWCGQLSLGQFAFVGLGSVLTGTFEAHGLSFGAAVGFATIFGALAGVLVGAPALRIRGLMLPVTTFAFAVAASTWFFPLPFISGAGGSLSTPPGTLFGINLANERNYYYLCLAVLVALSLAVAHWRKTGVGRVIIAVRENQERAESLTVSPSLVKLSVFAFTAGVAALSGGLLAGLRVNFDISNFGATLSLQILAIVIIGGLGTVSGAILGTVYVIGLPAVFGSSTDVVLLTSGVGLLLLLLYLPGGLISVVYTLRDTAYEWLATRLAAVDEQEESEPVVVKKAFPASTAKPTHGESSTAGPVLVARDINVALGGRAILNDISLFANDGETVGLIGANGAGKSTLMNALSGFVRLGSGTIELFGTEVSGMSAHQRARWGMGRIFQDARLFGDLTVREAVQVALESREHSEFIPSLLSLPPSRRAERRKQSEAGEIIAFLGLGRYAESPIATLSTGTRRIVELSCLIAQDAKLLLLDEPTAGIAQREVEAFAPLVVRISRELRATVLIIEHDLPLVSAISDRMYCMALGSMIAEGTPEQVSHDPVVIAAYLGTDERLINRSGAAMPLAQEGAQ